MTARDQILHRIRSALRAGSPEPPPAPPAGTPASWLPRVGGEPDDWRRAFGANAAALAADCPEIDDEAGARAHLRAIADRDRWRRLAAHGDQPAAIAGSLGLPVVRTDAGYDAMELEQVDAALTGCDALVAQTGSVVVSTSSAGGRGLSILPPHHVVVARRDQLVPDLPAAFAVLASRYGGGWPSLVSFITGPSRTGDIERILVLGAHGPRKLTILIW